MKTMLSILFSLCASLALARFDGDPVYANESATNGVEFFAVRPFYSKSKNPEAERWRQDYLWPVYTRKGFKDETYSRFLFFGFSNDFSKETNRHRTWVLPFYYKGVDSDGEKYFAIFPLGGTIHEFLGRDKMKFVLFPLYGKSKINDVETTAVLWPIGSKSSGEKVERFRIWPFYGRSSLQNKYNKKFILWPVYTAVEYTNDHNPGGGFILFPLYGQVKTERASSYWVIPPFFRYMHSDAQWMLNVPWPFLQFADGEIYKRIVWPFYGKKKLGTLTQQYFLWPIIWNNKTQYLRHEQHRRYIVPLFFYQSDVVTKKTEKYNVGDVSSRYWKLWPLMSWERKGGHSRFRTLELWPMRHTPGIERNWASYWTLYSRTHVNAETKHKLLWGLYNQAKSEECFEWSLLKGLVGYKKEDNHRRYRILFMWIGKNKELL